jgi:hypothetical protein
MSTTRRAIGIIRVSDAGGRKGESFTSPKTQRQSIEQECEREGLTLLDCFEEIDVSGWRIAHASSKRSAWSRRARQT